MRSIIPYCTCVKITLRKIHDANPFCHGCQDVWIHNIVVIVSEMSDLSLSSEMESVDTANDTSIIFDSVFGTVIDS